MAGSEGALSALAALAGGAAGGNVTVINTDTIQTDVTMAGSGSATSCGASSTAKNCVQAPAIFAQSVGGGGGDGGSSGGLVAVGGHGGAGSKGGGVYVQNTGNLSAFGDFSSGVYAQSVGGGGGKGGSAYGIGVFASVAVGGTGGLGGDGGNVCVSGNGSATAACTGINSNLSASTIQTQGFNSAGIFAQSVGGGGGDGGGIVSTSLGIYGSGSVGIGGDGGNAGHGGNVYVAANGAITTQGDFWPASTPPQWAGAG